MRLGSKMDFFILRASSWMAEKARLSPIWIAALVALAPSGCRHPATREECNELFTKSAEIELHGQNITDPKAIAERIESARSTPKGSEFTSQCVGKRITDRALKCVRQAA